MRNYSFCSSQSNKTFENGPILNTGIFLLGLFIIFGLILMMKHWEWVIYVMIGIFSLILGLLTYLAVVGYIRKPLPLNQYEQTIEDVREYFSQINEKNK